MVLPFGDALEAGEIPPQPPLEAFVVPLGEKPEKPNPETARAGVAQSRNHSLSAWGHRDHRNRTREI